MGLDEDHRDRLERLHTAILADVMDDLGIEEKVLDISIRPVWGRETVAGTAHTVQMAPVGYETEGHFQAILDSMTDCDDGDIVVRSTPDIDVGCWGELLSTAARAEGAVGAVVDGPTRDTRKVEELGFPTWATGHSALDSNGRVDISDWDVPVVCGGVTVHPGDVIVADYEGVVRIPPEHLDAVLDRAEEDFETEQTVREEIESGRDFEAVYREHKKL
ncbi:MAG: RraA family protein [Halobacteriaceae archaeon]